jgi:succinate-semialdehyde dehydrogenase/glutarate-semialdehyde dehydrogenase
MGRRSRDVGVKLNRRNGKGRGHGRQSRNTAVTKHGGRGQAFDIVGCQMKLLRQITVVNRRVSSLVFRTMSTGPPSALRDGSLFKTGAFIGNQWIAQSASGKTYVVENPATGTEIARVVECGKEECDTAIQKASEAFKPWSTRTGKSRAALLQRWYEEIVRSRDDITTLMTLECGKPLSESRNEFDSGVESILWFAEEAKRVTGDVIETPSDDKQFMVLKQPLGVVGQITPWNFPFSMITRKVAPALAAGCTVVLKPSELTPLTALALAHLAEKSGIPRGVLNVLSGDPVAIGKSLTDSDTVRKISFTGSTRVGKLLYAASANTMKHVSLELGGNAPYIVFDDADVKRAARDVVLSSHRNAGQTCICTNRVFVHESIHDQFVEMLVSQVNKLRLGDGLNAGVTHGPVITREAVDQVDDKVLDAVQKGAQVLTGGRRPDGLGAGFFYEPTVLSNATKDMKVFQSEIFGPITPIFKFGSDDEVIQLANSTEYGLAAYFYTKDLSRTWTVAKALEFGMVGVNQVAITSEVAPFGGWKHSGLGREHSKYGLDEYLDKKTVCIGLK